MDLMGRVCFKPDIGDLFDLLLGLQPFCDRKRVFLLPIHAQGQRFDSPDQQPTVKRRKPRSRRLKQIAQLLRERLVAHRQKAGNRIVMTA